MLNSVCIAGSGVKNIISLGLLQKYYENGKLNNIISYIGCSSGAIIVTLLSIGYEPKYLLELLLDNKEDLSKIFIEPNSIFEIINEGYVSYDKLNKFIEKPILEKFKFIPTLKELYELTKKDLEIVAFNYTKQHTVYLSHNDKFYENLLITDSIRMSCALPIFFKKVIYKQDLYLDGWMRDKFPLKYIAKKYNKILAINVIYNFNGNFSHEDGYLKIFMNLYNNITTIFPETHEDLLDKSEQYYIPYDNINLGQLNHDRIMEMYNFGYFDSSSFLYTKL
jgi:predicted acylesterase/phospholipase RssA